MPFEKSVLVPLNADETFALITQPDRLRRWQVITARVDLRAGGEYRWTVTPGNSAAGTFTEVEPGRRVVFTWGWEGSAELPPGASTVIITLEPAAGGTMVHLTHEGLSGEQEASHAEGWTHYLGRLVAAATAGDAGPDEWAAKPDLAPLSSAEATLASCQRVLHGVAEDDLVDEGGEGTLPVLHLAGVEEVPVAVQLLPPGDVREQFWAGQVDRRRPTGTASERSRPA